MRKVTKARRVLSITGVAALLVSFTGQVKTYGGTWTSLGPGGVQPRGLAVSPGWPTDQTIVFGTAMPGTFYRTTDGGTNWWSTRPLGSTSDSHIFDAVGLSPDYGSDQTVLLGGSNSGGVYLSTNSGENWSRDPGPGTVWDFAVSPSFPTDHTVFVSGNKGVYKSTNGGLSFSPVNSGLPGLPNSHFALAISSDYSNDHTIFVGVVATPGLYKSVDGGATWAPSDTGLPTPDLSEPAHYVVDLCISPGYAGDGTIFAGVDQSGIYRSANGGANWTPVYPDADRFKLQSFAISPNYEQDGTVFAATLQFSTWTGVLFSSDGGNTWSKLDNTGLPTPVSLMSVAISPSFALDQRIFGGTNNGVWTTTVTPNSPPIADAGPDQVLEGTSPDGAEVTLDGSGSSDDGQIGPLTYSWAWTGGSTTGVTATTTLPLGTKVVTLTVDDGEFTDTDEVLIRVEDTTPPIISCPTDITVETHGASVPAENPAIQAFLAGASASDICDSSPDLTHDAPIAFPLGTNVVAFTAMDDSGNQSTRSATVTVAQTPQNSAPVILDITAPQDPMQVNAGIAAVAAFWDPDTGDIHTTTWDWGDDNDSAGSVNEGEQTVSGTHTYAVPGVYTVTLTVVDAAGGSDADIFEFVVVYDPSAGFVTGGGWIDSPAGAYVADPTLAGTANFGFVSRYKKGASVPDGQTEFIFQTAGLNFHSSSYDWLVVTGSDYAVFKGWGSINGEGPYRFMLWARDDAPDTFRIKIWWEEGETEHVVYDNGSEQTIGGGAIVVHTK